MRNCTAFILFVVLLTGNTLQAQEQIRIDATLDSGAFNNYTGFIHGKTALHRSPQGMTNLKALKPKFWRNANWNNTQVFADSLGINTSLVISDFYAQYKGGYANAKPWLNWAEYEKYVDTLVKATLLNNIAPTTWDVWNEPDNSYYWSGTSLQLIECFVRTHNILMNIDKSLKMVGPSLNYYDGPGFSNLLDLLAAQSVKLHAISWHEFGLPDSMAVHIADFKNRIAQHPTWGDLQIHINEYSPSATHQVPAFRLAWLYQLEKSNISWANTACWGNHNDGGHTWSGCDYGLNGLLSYDETTPLPIYWVYRSYAEMLDGKKILAQSNTAKSIALASKNDALKEMRVLLGRYFSAGNGALIYPQDAGKEIATVTLKIKNYPYTSGTKLGYKLSQIPKGTLVDQNSPLRSPIAVDSGNVAVVGDSISFVIANFKDGEVYVLDLQEALTSGLEAVDGLENTYSSYPKPFKDILYLKYPQDIGQPVQIWDLTGRMLLQVQPNSDGQLDLSTLSKGVYRLHLGTWSEMIVKE